MKTLKNFVIILICIVAVYFVGDKLALWPAGVRDAVNRSFENMQAMFKKDENLTTLSDDNILKEETEENMDDEAIEAWNNIYNNLKEMSVEEDIRGLMEYARLDEEEATDLCKMFKDKSYNNFDSQNTYIVWSNDKYYLMETTEYLVTGTDPNTHIVSSEFPSVIEKKDGEWRLVHETDYTEEERNECNSAIFEMYAPECREAYFAGRNGMQFGNYMFTHPEMTYSGCFNNEIIAAWQNEDGSIDVQFCCANGLPIIKTIKYVQFTLTDDTLGTICDVTLDNYSEAVTPGRNKVFSVHVDPSQVRTGTSTWGHVNIDINYKYM